MKTNKNRPVNLDLTTFKFPLTSISSILHRMSGFLLFLAVPVLLAALGGSLSSLDGYNSVMAWGESFFCRLIVGILVAALFFHLIAGIKHLLMDAGYGETLEQGHLFSQVSLWLGLGGGALLFLIILF